MARLIAERRDPSNLRAHLPIEVLGVENMIVQVGDPLAP
jgi:hypothetical protein